MRLDIQWSAKIDEDGDIHVKGLAPDAEIRIHNEMASHGTVRADITLGNSAKPVPDCYGFRDLRYPITAISRVGGKLRLLGYDFDTIREINRIEEAIQAAAQEVLNDDA